MKAFCLVLLVTLSASATVSSKYLSGHQKRQQGPDYGPGPNKDAMCNLGMRSCMISFVEKYNLDSNPQLAASAIAEAGSSALCGDLLDGKSCVESNLNGDSCENMNGFIRSYFRQGLNLVNFLCVERRQDLDENWECLMRPSPEVQGRIQQCVDLCVTERVLDCMVDVINSIPTCTESAGDLFRQTVLKILPFTASPQCPAGNGYEVIRSSDDKEFFNKNVASVLQHLWK